MIAVEFVPLADRRFLSIAVDLTEPVAPYGVCPVCRGDLTRGGAHGGGFCEEADETDRIAAAITLPVTDAVVKITYRCTDEQHRRVDHRALLAFLTKKKAHKATILPDIVRPVRARVEGFTADLGPHEALDAWCDRDGTADGLRAALHSFLGRSREASAGSELVGGGVLEPVSLTASNVGRFREFHADFTEGATALIAPNGSGKSVVLRCVDLALYAKGPDLRRELAPWADSLEIVFVFDLDGVRHRVRRVFRRKDRKAYVDFERLNESAPYADTWITLTRETTAATQTAIDTALGMDRELSALSWMLMQGNASAFLQANPADRKAALAKPLDPAGVYPAAVALAKAEAKAAVAEIAGAQAQIAEREQRLEALPALNERVAELGGDQDTEIARVEADTRVLEAAQAALAAVAENAANVRTLTLQRDHAKATLDLADLAVATARRAADELPAVQSELAALTLQAALVEGLEAKLDEQRRALLERDNARERKRQAEAHAATCEGEATRLRQEWYLLDRRRQDALIRLVHKREAEPGKERCDRCKQIEGVEALESEIDFLMGDVARLTDESLDKADAAEDADTRWGDAKATLAAIVVPAVEEGTFGLELHAARTAAEKKPGVAAKVERLAEQAGRLPDLAGDALTALQTFEDARDALAAATAGVADEAELQKAVAEARTALTARRAALDETTAELVRHRQTVEQLQQAEVEIADLMVSACKKHEELDVLRLAERAFGRDGIPVLLVETVLAQFEADTNAILARFPTADGQTFTVRFETQREQVTTDTLREELYVIVSAPDYEQEFETLSGGEESRVSFAVRYALSQMLGRLRGARSRLLVLDELSFLDAEGEAALVGLVREGIEAGDFSFVVLVSHSPNVRDAFEQTIEVVKDGGVSRIVSQDGDGLEVSA